VVPSHQKEVPVAHLFVPQQRVGEPVLIFIVENPRIHHAQRDVGPAAFVGESGHNAAHG
jgi:hypothetical protein